MEKNDFNIIRDIDDNFIKQITKLVSLITLRYENYNTGYDFDDLVHEGIVIALETRSKWIKAGKNNKGANIINWVWVSVETKLKELIMKGQNEIPLDDDIEAKFSMGELQLMEDLADYITSENEAKTMVNTTRNDTPRKKHELFTSTAEVTYASKVTRQRVSQLKQDLVKDWNPNRLCQQTI